MATPQLGNSLLKPESGWTRKHCSLANVGPGNFFTICHYTEVLSHKLENGM